jgi:tripartite-type tricarboxylate transporter receptor subunit TctC
MQNAITALGSEVMKNSPTQFGAYIAAQTKRWSEVGKAAGVRVN